MHKKNGSNLSYHHSRGGAHVQTTGASTVAHSALQTHSHRKPQNREHLMSPSSDGQRNNSHHSRSRSYTVGYESCEPDSKDNVFIYPCRAFKQFFLTLKEGKINLNDIEKMRPDLMEYLGGGRSPSPDQKRRSGSRSVRPPSYGRPSPAFLGAPPSKS